MSITRQDAARSLLEGVGKKFNQSVEISHHSKEVGDGLEEWEEDFFGRFARGEGSILDIGCGAGREAIALAKLGYDVTGIDMADKMVEAAKTNAAIANVKIKFETRSATEIDYPLRSFDYVVFSRAIYSFIPTKELRINTLRSVKAVLKPEGLAAFSAYYYGKRRWYSRTYLFDMLKKLMSLVLQSRSVAEPGDALLRRVSVASDPSSSCFVHFFSSPLEVRQEIMAAGLKIIEGENSPYWVVRP